MSTETQKLESWENVLTNNTAISKFQFDLIKYPVITEKSYIALFKNRQYAFDVDTRLTKSQIKILFEKLFSVKIVSINTQIPPRKKLRVASAKGYKTQYKRVYFTLQEGQKIDFTL